MTKTQMESIRMQPACLVCQRTREAEINDPCNLNHFTSHSAVAIANALECDNCLILVQVRFGLVRDSQGDPESDGSNNVAGGCDYA